ncbi:MAG: sulfatase-like hydrolase/transferase [Bacteroidota bacterium]
MNLRLFAPAFLLLIAVFLPVTGTAQTSDEPVFDRPNIVWIVAEDLGPYLPSFGDSTIETPNLSRLAAEGVRYTRVFSPSGVCAPSRAALATGMYQNAIGAQHMRTGGNPRYFPEGVIPYEARPAPGVKMHSEYMRMLGYYATNNAKEDYQFTKPLTAWDASNNKAHWKNRPDPDQPFFAIFNLGVTHESQIWARADDPLLVDANLDVPIPPYYPDTEVVRTDLRRMYSNIKIMDQQVGELLDELEAAGELENTVIFWYADHGGPLPRMKRLLYDSGMRVPMIVRFPNQWRAGEVDDQLVSFIDFKPTILSLAGMEPPSYLKGQGQAFLGPYKADTQRTYVHGAGDRFDGRYDLIRAVRDKRFKYLRNHMPERGYYLPVRYREQMALMQELLKMRDAGTLNEVQMQWFRPAKPLEELFDTAQDPHEINNLAADPAYVEKLAELRQEHDRWIAAIDDNGMVPEQEHIARVWPDGIQPAVTAPAGIRQGQFVSLTTATVGASIGYQVVRKGEAPTDHWMVYTAPVELKQGEELIAVADHIGYVPSKIVRFN